MLSKSIFKFTNETFFLGKYFYDYYDAFQLQSISLTEKYIDFNDAILNKFIS